jgi:hypothetical protein
MEKWVSISSCRVSRLGPMSWPLQSDDLASVDRFLRAYSNDKAYFHVVLFLLGNSPASEL